jgi:hypothetical protein
MAGRDHPPFLREGIDMRPRLIEKLFGMKVEERGTGSGDVSLDRRAPHINDFHCAFLGTL